jgi:hypothetical protein
MFLSIHIHNYDSKEEHDKQKQSRRESDELKMVNVIIERISACFVRENERRALLS